MYTVLEAAIEQFFCCYKLAILLLGHEKLVFANCSIEDLHTYGISILHGWVGAVLLVKHISSSNISVVAKQLVNGHEELSVWWPEKILRRKERKEAAPLWWVVCRRGERPSSGTILSCSKNSMEEVRLLHVRRKYSGQGSRHTITASSSSYATAAPYQQLAGSLQEVTDSHGDHVMWGVSPTSKKRLTVPELHHPCNVKPNIIGGSSYHELHIVVELSSFAVGCTKLELGKIFPLYYKNAGCAIEESSLNSDL